MSRRTILLVEDHADIREAIRLLLTLEGYEVVAAEDGISAICLLRQCRPDLILTDLMMPEMDGRELIRCVRELDRLSALPIVAFSAFPGPHLEEAVRCGANAALRKPDNLPDLAAAVARALGGSG